MKKNFLFVYFLFCFSFSIFAIRPQSWALKVESNHFDNFWKLNDSIYRSEQPDDKAFDALMKMSFKSILNLRSNHDDQQEAGNHHFELYNIPMEAKEINEEDIINALSVLKKCPKPVLIHCKHGSDRTGVVVAMYRIVFQHWPKQKAIDELKNGGYGFHSMYDNIISFVQKANVNKIRKLVLFR